MNDRQLDDHQLAWSLALDASELLLRLRTHRRPGGVPLAKAGRDRSSALLVERLGTAKPDDGLLTEDTVGDDRRLGLDRVWIVDPLDGADAYAAPRGTAWFVHVALWEVGRLVTGAIGLPARGLVLGTAPGHGPVGPDRRLDRPVRTIGVAGRRPPRLAERAADALGARLARFDSPGASAVAALLGNVDAHLAIDDDYEWRSAAAVAVARSAGLHAGRLDGSRLEYNKPWPLVPDLLICRQSAAEGLLSGISARATGRLP